MIGLLTGMCEAFSQENPDRCCISAAVQEYELFCRYEEVIPDYEKAQKVERAMQFRFGEENYKIMCQALTSYEGDRADAVFHAILAGMRMKNRFLLMQNLADPYVMRVFELQREVGRELNHFHGFLRFRELKNGILMAVIAPKNNIAAQLAPHFSDRFPNENFLIYDEIRKIAVDRKSVV